MPRRIGDRVAKLIGAAEGTVVMGDTLSIKVYQALASALDLVRNARSCCPTAAIFRPTFIWRRA
jgi:kynureninase